MSSTSHLQDQPWSKLTRAQSHTGLASSLAWPPADGVILARTPNSSVLACAGSDEDSCGAGISGQLGGLRHPY